MPKMPNKVVSVDPEGGAHWSPAETLHVGILITLKRQHVLIFTRHRPPFPQEIQYG